MANFEIFKDIAGYEGKYQVSNFGNIKSLNYHRENKEKIMTPKKSKSGYLIIGLRRAGIKKFYLISRLVAKSFLENNDNKQTVNHINGIKTDNNIENLEWATISENTKHAFRTGLAMPLTGDKNGMSNKNRSDKNKQRFIGENNPCCKIPDHHVFIMHALYKEGKTLSFISKLFNKNAGTVHELINFKKRKYFKEIINE